MNMKDDHRCMLSFFDDKNCKLTGFSDVYEHVVVFAVGPDFEMLQAHLRGEEYPWTEMEKWDSGRK